MKKKIVLIVGLIAVSILLSGCLNESPPESDTGIKKQSVKVPVDANGYTVEQNNIIRRLEETNKPGAMYQFYSISSYTGDVMISNTINGKVTSSGKRLTPTTVESAGDWRDGFSINIGGQTKTTTEVLQDDGAYGDSIPYLFWWDVNDIYHQHYPSDEQMIIISSQPLKAKSAVIDLNIVQD